MQLYPKSLLGRMLLLVILATSILVATFGLTSYRMISSLLADEQEFRAQNASDFVRSLAVQQLSDLQDRIEIVAKRLETRASTQGQISALLDQENLTVIEVVSADRNHVESNDKTFSLEKSTIEVEMISWAQKGKPLQAKFVRHGSLVYMMSSRHILHHQVTKNGNYAVVTGWLAMDDAWVARISALAKTEVQIVIDDKIVATSINRLRDRVIVPVREGSNAVYTVGSIAYHMNAISFGNAETEQMGLIETGEDLDPLLFKLRSRSFQMIALLLVFLTFELGLVVAIINRQTKSLKHLVWTARKIAETGPESFQGMQETAGEASEITTVRESFELMSKALLERIENLKATKAELQGSNNTLQKATQEAIAANQAKSQFLANMSHEIRTPLNGMLGFIGLLEKSNLNKSQFEQVRIIARSGRLLLTIISDILEFSKIEAGKLIFESADFSVETCVEDIVEVLSHQAFEKNLEFPVFLDEGIPKTLQGDEGRLRQVLLNLIGNAIKFTEKGEVAVFVRALGENKNGCYEIYFEVKDTGFGISQEAMLSIFSAFSQGDISDTRKFGGTGLGLTISKQIIEALGGKIELESKEGKGSRFFFTIPFQKPNTGSTDSANRKFTQSEEVLVLSENATAQSYLVKRLMAWHAQCGAVASLSDVKWTLGGESNRSLLVDSSTLKDLDDWRKIKKLHAEKAHIILLTTPGDRAALAEQAEGLEIDILVKPVKQDELFNLISKKHSQQRETTTKAILPASNKVGKGLHVLVAEDNLVNQLVTTAMLKANGFTADVVSDGQQAVAKFGTQKYDLILMDCQMPVMDGFAATIAIREIDKSILIIAMTANSFKEVRDKCLEVGMNDFVTKPINDTELSKAILKNLALQKK